MQSYDTLVDALNDLSKRGFTHSLDVEANWIYSKAHDLKIHPEDFEIVEFHRFEGMNNPGDSSVVYAIESKDHQIKGVIVSAYGVYADNDSTELLRKLKFQS